MKTKTCKRCEEELTIEQFYMRNKKKPYMGYNARCKKCHNEMSILSRSRRADVLLADRQYRQSVQAALSLADWINHD